MFQKHLNLPHLRKSNEIFCFFNDGFFSGAQSWKEADKMRKIVAVLGLCFMSVCPMKSNCYSLIYFSLVFFRILLRILLFSKSLPSDCFSWFTYFKPTDINRVKKNLLQSSAKFLFSFENSFTKHVFMHNLCRINIFIIIDALAWGVWE